MYLIGRDCYIGDLVKRPNCGIYPPLWNWYGDTTLGENIYIFQSSGLQESRHEDCFKSKLGTSGATVPVIDTPKQHGEQEADAPRFDHYDFIGTSAEIFKETKNLLGAQANCLSFGLLDVETDPIEQGFEAKMYDLIIASNVFHATKTLDCLLANIRKLLRPRVNSFYLK